MKKIQSIKNLDAFSGQVIQRNQLGKFIGGDGSDQRCTTYSDTHNAPNNCTDEYYEIRVDGELVQYGTQTCCISA